MKLIEGKLAEVEEGLKIANSNNAKIEMDVRIAFSLFFDKY